MRPENHQDNFPASWWTERRKRDYFVDQHGCVQLRPDSPTGVRVRKALLAAAHKMALELSQPTTGSMN